MRLAKIILGIALALAIFWEAYSETIVSGVISRETRWMAEDGPFIIEGGLVIAKRANLVIAPGTRVIIRKGSDDGGPIEPFDKADSVLVSIRVQGSINCVGRRDRPITFEPEISELAGFSWRGIILDEADGLHTEIAFTGVSGAATGITIKNSSALVRNSAFENNNIGVHAMEGGAPRIFNNLVSNCFTVGIKVERSNPQIFNNIIAFNNNVGLWCDNRAKVVFKYNCVFGNADGDFLDCDPELGRLARGGRNKDSTDVNGNLIMDPVFVGSPAEIRAMELDVNLQTDSSKVRDTRLWMIPNLQFGGPPRKSPALVVGAENRQLSKYSPCINMGDPGGRFRNADGTRNTMGPSGGPDFFGK